jgi:NADPH:quinone reductase-like Zn-dependent oxidoreductase
VTVRLGPTASELVSAGPLTAYLATKGLATIASGGAPPSIKVFAHAASLDGVGVFLLELLVDPGSKTASVTVKSDAESARGIAMERVVADSLGGF